MGVNRISTSRVIAGLERLYGVEKPTAQDQGEFADWWLWMSMKSHRYCRIDTDSMGCPREEHPGRIVCLRTAEYDTHVDQKGYTYSVIRYDDGEDDRIPYMTGGDGWPRSRCIFFDEEMQRYQYTR